MDAKQTVKYVAFHQVLATLAAVVGLGIVGVGAWLGFGDAAQIVLRDAPQNWGDAVAAANPTTFVALAVVGVIVWQVGKTVALVVTIGKVADAAGGGGGADAAEVKQAVLSDVDDRISSVESDVKRHEEALSDADRASSGGRAGRASESASASGESGGRRSRRRGSTSEDASAGESASSSGGESADAAGDRESNRKSNRRASRSSESGSADGGDGSAN